MLSPVWRIELIVAFIPLKQDVTGDAAIANEVGSPQPVGVLNGRQREGRANARRRRAATSGCEAAGVASGLGNR